MSGESILADLPINRIVSSLKQFGKDSLKQYGVSGIKIDDSERALVNDLERYPHAFVLACIADRQTKAEIAWSLPHKIREAAGDFEFETLAGLQGNVWSSALSDHRLAAQMERLLPAAIRLIGDRYGRGRRTNLGQRKQRCCSRQTVPGV